MGLRSGCPARVTIVARPGPITLLACGREALCSELQVIDATRATTVAISSVRVATVEHLFAACAGLGLHDGLRIEVEGGEVPLLDGSAFAFALALRSLGIARSQAPLAVRREATLTCGESRYDFSPLSRGTPRASTLSVTLEYADRRIAPDAAWDGTADDFLSRIARARTFALAEEIAGLVRAGHASHITPESVVVFGPGYVLSAGAPFMADEPARHKLLDLMGDLFLYGGPPKGHVHALRPGHLATHTIVREALEKEVLG